MSVMMETGSAKSGDSESWSAADHIDLVVKLGGAAITDKSVCETLLPEQLGQGAALVSLCHSAGLRVVVVHGGGSFGHFHAKKYNLKEGLKDGNYRGFCETRNSMTKLNRHVVESLTDCGLPAVACPAFPSWQTCDGVVSVFPKEVVRSVLTAGLIPVLHGDGVLDKERGYCVLSGDTIIQTLCANFRVRRVVFLTDVSGVYDRPPSEQGAQLLHTIQLWDGAVCGDVKLSATANDVTGGILKKIQSAHNIVVSSCEKTRVFITNVGSQEAQQLCLENDVDIMELQATEIVHQS